MNLLWMAGGTWNRKLSNKHAINLHDREELLWVWIPIAEADVLRRKQSIVPKERLRAPCGSTCDHLEPPPTLTSMVAIYMGGGATISHCPITSLKDTR